MSFAPKFCENLEKTITVTTNWVMITVNVIKHSKFMCSLCISVQHCCADIAKMALIMMQSFRDGLINLIFIRYGSHLVMST